MLQGRETLELPATERPRALHALRAGLHAIRDRLPAAEVVDLGAQLPTLIRGFDYEGWTLANDPTRMRDRDDMIERVKKELMLDPRLDPVDVLRAVIHLLVEHVSPGSTRIDTQDQERRASTRDWHDRCSVAEACIQPASSP